MKFFNSIFIVGALMASSLAWGQSTTAAALSKVKVPPVAAESKADKTAAPLANTAKETPATTQPTFSPVPQEVPTDKPVAKKEPAQSKPSSKQTKVVPITLKANNRGWSAFTTGGEKDLAGHAKEIASGVAESSSGPETAQARQIGMQVSNWDLSEVLLSLTTQTGVNIVLISDLNPKVTVSLQSMPIDEVVRVVSSIAKMSVIGLRGGYVVGPKEVLAQAFPDEWRAQSGETMVGDPANIHLETYTCRHVDPTQLADALKGVYTEQLSVKVGPGKLRPIDLEMGAGGGSGDSGASGGGAMPGAAELPKGRQLVITGPRPLVMQALALAKRLDTKQPQVSIQVEIVDVSNDALKDLGVNWQGTTDVAIEESAPRGINFGSFARDPLTIGATLRHLETTGRAKVLAKPNISLLDQERGYILIGNRINYPVVVSINDAGQPVFDVKEERVGIYLQVAAAVNEVNDVTLNLYPQVSTITGFLTVNQSSYPQISTREARTSLRVQSGQTVVMGGLISDEEIRTVEKVPILSQIPLFGELFTRRKNSTRSSQVVILITPTVDTKN